ncbi:neuropeptide FF receptor 2-like [Acropora palmata]|uniref:neuropeptide FF receptor 2-like n=1 Tax=Acropora palmata TaxID=6131 RepID=UPI003DA10E72
MALSSTDTFKAALLALIFMMTLVGNLIVSIVLTRYRRVVLKNRPTYQFILNMVLSDLVVGLLTMPFEFISYLCGKWIFGRVACKIVEFIEIAVLGTALFTHALIAFDRYRCLARPYLPKMETRVVRKMIILSWIVPAFISSPYLYMFDVIDSEKICTPNSIPIMWLDKLYVIADFFTIRLTPFAIVCWCYFHVARIMLGRSPQVLTDSAATRLSVIVKNKKRVTRTACLVAISFAVCWIPTFVMNFVRVISGTDRVYWGHLLHEIAMFGTFINEAVNPIIYCAFDENIRERLRLLFSCNHDENIGRSTNETEKAYRPNIANARDIRTHKNFRGVDCSANDCNAVAVMDVNDRLKSRKNVSHFKASKK